MKQRGNAKGVVPVLWEGQMESSNHRVTLQQRLDRKLLLSLFEQGHQICQLRLDVFGEIKDQSKHLDPSDDILTKGWSS